MCLPLSSSFALVQFEAKDAADAALSLPASEVIGQGVTITPSKFPALVPPPSAHKDKDKDASAPSSAPPPAMPPPAPRKPAVTSVTAFAPRSVAKPKAAASKGPASSAPAPAPGTHLSQDDFRRMLLQGNKK
jgi:hypothetical protein